ncbi:MAG: hypothetical protein ABSG86_15180 [Thermoguttaceae bacterium]|jgi:hypothetical protein
MHLLGFIVAAGAMLSMVVPGVPAKAEDPATPAPPAVATPAPPQAPGRAWLGQLEERFTRAARLTLDPAEARQEQARAAALLARPTVARETLAELLGQLDRREKAAISRLVRQYRLLVQQSFHDQPAGFVARREAWFRVWSRWEAAGSLPDQQDRLIDWLEAAIRSSRPGAIAPLPADPRFGPVAPPGPVAKAAPPGPVAKAVPPASRVGPPAAVRIEPAPVPVRLPEPSVSAPRLRDTWRPVPQVAAMAAHRAGPPADETPPAAFPPPVRVPTPKIIPRIPAAESRPSEPPRAPPRDEVLALLPGKAEEPGAIAGKSREGPGPAVLVKATAQPSSTPPEASGEVQVDLAGLAVRIAGLNLALRTLEGELEAKREWSADQLQSTLSHLDILILRQKDLGLFRDLVAPQEQAKVGTIESPRRALAALAARIAEARSRLRGPEADQSDAGHRAALRHLDDLSDRLAVLATEK